MSTRSTFTRVFFSASLALVGLAAIATAQVTEDGTEREIRIERKIVTEGPMRNKVTILNNRDTIIILNRINGVDSGEVSTIVRMDSMMTAMPCMPHVAPFAGPLSCGGGSFLGVMGDEVAKEDVSRLRLPGEYGALVQEVIEGTSAEKAGLEADDVIVGWNGSRVESMAMLARLVGETPAGRSVRITVIRNGVEQEIEADLGTRPAPQMDHFRVFRNGPLGDTAALFFQREFFNNDQWKGRCEEMKKQWEEKGDRYHEEMERIEEQLRDLELSFQGPEGNFDLRLFGDGANGFSVPIPPNMVEPQVFSRMIVGDRGRMGATVQSLSPQLSRYFKLDEGQTGALVADVNAGSAAEKAGLRAGDVIIAVDGNAIETPFDVARTVCKAERETELRVIRDGAEQTIRVQLEERVEEAPSTDEMIPMPESEENAELSQRW